MYNKEVNSKKSTVQDNGRKKQHKEGAELRRARTVALGAAQDPKSVRILLIGIVTFFCLYGFWGYRFRQNQFVYEKSLEDTVMTVDGRELSLREFGYYIYQVESFLNEQAIVYDPSDPLSYWNKRFMAGRPGAFVSVMGRNKAYEICVCDLIYEEMAREGGYELTEEEQEKAREEADRLFRKMTEAQRTKTGLTKELVEDIQCRKKLVAKFAKDYVKTIDFDGYTGYREELISAGGAYYEQVILPEHTVQINERIKYALKFGRITINL